jgi:hypothetical protein
LEVSKSVTYSGVEPHWATARPACVAQHSTSVATATENATIGQGHPVPATLDLQIDQPYVQIAGRIGAERRATLELVMDRQDVLAGQGSRDVGDL